MYIDNTGMQRILWSIHFFNDIFYVYQTSDFVQQNIDLHICTNIDHHVLHM